MGKLRFGNDVFEEYEICHEEEEENDDGETETNEYWGEYYGEFSVVGYDFECPLHSESEKVSIFYYLRKPDSEWFDKFCGYETEHLVPLVYTFDSRKGRPDELLNESIESFSVKGLKDGFFCMEVKLKRKLKKNERIFFGVYSYDIFPVWSDVKIEGTGKCREYCGEWDKLMNKSESEVESYIENGFMSGAKEATPQGNYALYVLFDGVDPVSYIRKVYAGFSVFASSVRKAESARCLGEKAFVSGNAGAGRILKRLCKSAAGLWEYIKGKIRVEKNIVSFFCPVETEILLECGI